MNKSTQPDLAPWLLLPAIVLALSGVTLLAPNLKAQATVSPPPAPNRAPAPKTLPYDDGDGDELLEHWGDPRYSHEEQKQMAGMAIGFFVLGVFASRRRVKKKVLGELIQMPTEADFLKLDKRKAA
ncbi:MAG: hypothetical protein ACRYFS_03495 [Janthinobacterium lividum]